MLLLKIIGWTVLALLIVLLLLLFLPVTLRFRGGSETKLDVWIKLAGIRIWRKKDKVKKQPDKPTKPNKKTDFSTTVKTVVKLVQLMLGELSRFLSKPRVKKLRLVCVAADEDAADAALEYGAVCSVLYPLLDYMRQYMRLRERDSEVEIRCDFERDKPFFEIEVETSMLAGHIIVFAFRILRKKVMEDIADE